MLLPFLNDYNLINPFKRNDRNLKTFRGHLKEIMKSSKDPNSLCHKLFDIKELEYEKTVDDIIAFMIAGTDTSAHAVISILYFLKKYPDVEHKLRTELTNTGLSYGSDPRERITKKKLQEIDYLNYVIKEALRMDSPTVATFGYQTLEDVEICSVTIPKNTLMRLGVYNLHYNPREWQEPKRFIPERFDPESEYFLKPGQVGNPESGQKARSPYSWMSFSQGMRN